MFSWKMAIKDMLILRISTYIFLYTWIHIHSPWTNGEASNVCLMSVVCALIFRNRCDDSREGETRQRLTICLRWRKSVQCSKSFVLRTHESILQKPETYSWFHYYCCVYHIYIVIAKFLAKRSKSTFANAEYYHYYFSEYIYEVSAYQRCTVYRSRSTHYAEYFHNQVGKTAYEIRYGIGWDSACLTNGSASWRHSVVECI